MDALCPFTAAHNAILEGSACLLAALEPGADLVRERSRAREWFDMAEEQLRGLAYPEAGLVVAPPEGSALFHEHPGSPWPAGLQTLEAFLALRTSALAAGNPEQLVPVLAELGALIPSRHPDRLVAEAAAIKNR